MLFRLFFKSFIAYLIFASTSDVLSFHLDRLYLDENRGFRTKGVRNICSNEYCSTSSYRGDRRAGIAVSAVSERLTHSDSSISDSSSSESSRSSGSSSSSGSIGGTNSHIDGRGSSSSSTSSSTTTYIDPSRRKVQVTNGNIVKPIKKRVRNGKHVLTIDEKLERDILALKAFYAVHGHFRVPYYYIIPDERKGDICTNSRIRRKELEVEVPVPSALSSFRSSSSVMRGMVRTTIEKALLANITNNTNSSKKMLNYPSQTYGLKLGRRVAQIRNGEVYCEAGQRVRLASIGLVFSNRSLLGGKEDETEGIDGMVGKELYKVVGGYEGKYEESSNSIQSHTRVGNTEKKGKIGEIDGTQRTENSSDESEDYQLTSREYMSEMKFLDILSALKVHFKVYGDMLVPRYFIVPSEYPWPTGVWGMQLGNRVRNIRIKSAYNKPKFHKLLCNSGFVMNIDSVRMPLKSGYENEHD